MIRAEYLAPWTILLALTAGCCGQGEVEGVGEGAGDPEPDIAPIPLPVAHNASTIPLKAFAYPGPPYGEDVADGESALSDEQAEACFIGEDITGRAPMSLALVEVRGDGVRVWGADVMPLQEGRAAEDQAKGLMLLPLFDALLILADDMKAWGARGCAPWALEGEERDFAGRLLLAVEPGIPMGTANAVVYTAGQAQFGQVAFWVDDAEPGAAVTAWPEPTQGGSPWPTVSLDADGLKVRGGETEKDLPCPGGSCGTVADHDWDGLAQALGSLEVSAGEPGVMTGLPSSVPFAAWVRMADAVQGLPSPLSPVMVQPVEDPAVALSVVEPAAAPRSLDLDDQVTVLRASQPRITAVIGAGSIQRGELEIDLDELISTGGLGSRRLGGGRASGSGQSRQGTDEPAE